MIKLIHFLYISILIYSNMSIFAEKEIYPKGLDKVKYLTGDFPREKYFKTFTNSREGNSHLLREDTILALEEMLKAFDLEREGKSKQHIFISSAFRSYTDQKSIWEQKYSGTKKMREPVAGKTPEQIVNLILEFSSAPGTSRHHWGTDFDINVLTNEYYIKGNGSYLYSWLQKNASRFGFCQPYNELSKRENKGYNEERWHWSYAKVSNQLQKDWVQAYKNNEISFKGKFKGSEVLGERPLEYVTAINKDCEKIK